MEAGCSSDSNRCGCICLTRRDVLLDASQPLVDLSNMYCGGPMSPASRTARNEALVNAVTAFVTAHLNGLRRTLPKMRLWGATFTLLPRSMLVDLGR